MKKHVAGMLAAFLFMWFGAGHGIAPFILLPSVIFANAGNDMFSFDPAGTIGSFMYFPGLLLLIISLFITTKSICNYCNCGYIANYIITYYFILFAIDYIFLAHVSWIFDVFFICHCVFCCCL